MDALTRKAMAVWPALAVQMGERPGEWTPSRLAMREDARVSRILLRLDKSGATPLVLKHEDRPRRPQVFAEAVQAHVAAQEGFPDGVPAIRAVDLDRQSLVMDYVPGRPLSVVLDGASPQTQSAALRLAGAWLAGFHRGRLGDRRVFQPKFTLGFLDQVLAEISRGERAVSEPDLFRACAESLIGQRAEFEAQQTVAAATHGDMHMRNLLIGSDRAWGVDFAGGRVVPVGHDIGRLLADYAILRAPHADIPVGSVLPPQAEQAFFAGYDLVGPDDPSVRLLVRHRVLAEWWGLPVSGRSTAQERRWQRLKSLVPRVFAQH
ncbi:phosphotransferase [Thalassococcus arenae]|nr:aminoglycoside phosphotransferase family protein [Thalassococcus arenae]